MKSLYSIKKCKFQTRIFYDLADKHQALTMPLQAHVESESSEPPAKRSKPDVDSSVQLLDFTNEKLHKFSTDEYLISKYSHAYLYHLYDTNEFLGKTLLVMHNLRFLNNFLKF